MSLEAAFAPAEARYKAAIMADAWGHMAPRRNMKYRGYITWAVGCLGSDNLNPTVLNFELFNRDGIELDSSPWFVDNLLDFLRQHSREPGTVWRFDGWFRNYSFNGTISQIPIQTPAVVS